MGMRGDGYIVKDMIDVSQQVITQFYTPVVEEAIFAWLGRCKQILLAIAENN